MRKVIILGLVAALLGLAVASAILWNRLQQAERERALAWQTAEAARTDREERIKQLEHEQSRLTKQNMELTGLATSLRAAEASMKASLLAAAKGGSAAAEGANSTNPVDPATGKGGLEGLGETVQAMMKDPAMREMMRSQQKAVMNQLYGSMFTELGLTAEQRQKFLDLMVNSAMKGTERYGSVFQSESPERAATFKAIGEEQKQLNESLQALLGPEKFAQFEDYQKTMADRMQLNQFKQLMESGNMALRADQSTQLLNVLREEGARLPSVLPSTGGQSAEALQAWSSPETLSKHFERQARLNERVLERARQFLSREQLTEYAEFLNQQLSLQKMGLEFARKQFGGPKPGGDAPIPAAPSLVK